MIKFKPTRDRILVEPVHQAPVVGSIHIPEAVKEQRPAEAIVVALGPAHDLPVQVGDRVITDRYAGSEVRMGEARYRLVEARDLLAIVT